MSEKLCKNINLLMAEARLNAEELSRRVNIPASTIKKIRTREDANPTLSTLIPLAKYFSLTISELIGDEPIAKNRIKGSYKFDNEKLNYLPIISWQESICWPTIKMQTYNKISTEHEYSKNAYALLIEEDNWENLAKGTFLLVDPEIKVDHRDFAIIYKQGQKIPTLKQVLCDEDNVYLKPINQNYQIISKTLEHKILGVVVEYKKLLKKN